MAFTPWPSSSWRRIRAAGISSCSATGTATASRFCFGMDRVYGSAPTATLHNARFGLSLEILYPYHPLFGQEYEVFGAAGGRRDLVYVRLPDKTTKGVPAWMFDPAVCAGVRLAERPLIDCHALLRLARLLDSLASEEPTGGRETTPEKEDQRSSQRTCESVVAAFEPNG